MKPSEWIERRAKMLGEPFGPVDRRSRRPTAESRFEAIGEWLDLQKDREGSIPGRPNGLPAKAKPPPKGPPPKWVGGETETESVLGMLGEACLTLFFGVVVAVLLGIIGWGVWMGIKTLIGSG